MAGVGGMAGVCFGALAGYSGGAIAVSTLIMGVGAFAGGVWITEQLKENEINEEQAVARMDQMREKLQDRREEIQKRMDSASSLNQRGLGEETRNIAQEMEKGRLEFAKSALEMGIVDPAAIGQMIGGGGEQQTSAMSQLTQQIAALGELLQRQAAASNAPKEVVYGPDGRIVGVKPVAAPDARVIN